MHAYNILTSNEEVHNIHGLSIYQETHNYYSHMHDFFTKTVDLLSSSTIVIIAVSLPIMAHGPTLLSRLTAKDSSVSSMLSSVMAKQAHRVVFPSEKNSVSSASG